MNGLLLIPHYLLRVRWNQLACATTGTVTAFHSCWRAARKARAKGPPGRGPQGLTDSLIAGTDQGPPQLGRKSRLSRVTRPCWPGRRTAKLRMTELNDRAPIPVP